MCEKCRYAEWDYCTYYGISRKQFFVCGCTKDCDCQNKDCEMYEQYVYADTR